MNLELNREELCLQRRQLLKVRGGGGHAILCHSGSVWVTQERDQRDIILGAGESFALERDGLALVQALEPSAISIAPQRHRSGVAPRRAAPGRAPAAAGPARAAAGLVL